MPNNTSRSEARMTGVCPTLFIALGGTGAEIALGVRRRILSHMWGSPDNPVRLASIDEFPPAQFVYFDVDQYWDLPRSRKDSMSDLVKFSEEEKLNSALDLDKYLRADGELNKYTHIAEWFPLTRKNCLELYINPAHGPGQIRALSRLYFFDKYQHLKSMIQNKIDSLLTGVSSRAKFERMGMQIEPESLRVVVIASTAGGTGSGSFIDMGYLAKWLANMQVRGARVDLMLMLPGGFYSAGKKRIEANTYAALMELETCLSQDLEYVKGWTRDQNLEGRGRGKPYNDIFLFDTGNLALRKKENVTDLFDMVAGTLFEDFIPSDFTSRKCRNSIHQMRWKIVPFTSPVDAHKYGSMKMKYSKAYSAFGHSVIDTQIEQRLDKIVSGEDNSNPLITKLEGMDSSERRSLFQNCLEMAMPWIEANVEGIWIVNPDQYACAIGVDNAELFVQKFGAEFKSVVPTRAGMPATKINFYESNIPGKLTCYVELSGIPLTALSLLPNWRESYNEESKKIPVHTHKDKTLFVHPIVPSVRELDRLAQDFKLYIQGIICGILKPRKDEGGGLVYCVTVSGEELSIGNERIIRIEGILPEQLHLLKIKLAKGLDQVRTPAQLTCLAALYDYYMKQVYPRTISRKEDGMEVMGTGFANVMCAALRNEVRQSLVGRPAHSFDFAKVIDFLSDSNIWIDNSDGVGYEDVEGKAALDFLTDLDKWTDEIKGSELDVYKTEVGASHLPKRVLKPDFFVEGWLEAQFGQTPSNPVLFAGTQQEHTRPEKCPNPVCPANIEKKWKYCAVCGTRLSPLDEEPPPIDEPVM